jgi:hypothetical protein
MKYLEFFRGPKFALYAFSIWMISFLVIGGSQQHNNFSYLIIALPTLLTLSTKELTIFFKSRLSIYLVLTIFTLVLAAFFGAGDPLRQLKFGAIVLLFYLAIARLPAISNETAYKAAWAFLILIIVYIIFNMAWKYSEGVWEMGQRLGGLSGKVENPIYVTNTMGAMLAIITVLGIGARKHKTVVFAHFLVLSFCLIILQTRSIVGIWVLIMFLSYFTFRKTDNNTHLVRNLLFAVMSVAIIGLLFYTPIGESLLTRKFYRIAIWQGYITETFTCSLWLGCGPQHGYHYITENNITMVTPHSQFVTQFFRAGLIGFISLLALTFYGIKDGFKTKPWLGWYFIVGVLGLCFDGNSFIHSPNQRWLVYHIPLALIISQQLNMLKSLRQSIKPGD